MTDIDLKKLAEPFPPDQVSWRVGHLNGAKTSALALAYIDSRDVQQRLDDVCSPENWQSDHPWSDGKRLAGRIGIRINGDWVWKGDGAGATDVEAEKGAFSDATKRAAVLWGIGRYLYNIADVWVEVEKFGSEAKPQYRIKKSEYAKLHAALPSPGAASAKQPANTAESPRPKPVETQTPQQGAEQNTALLAIVQQIEHQIDLVKTKGALDTLMATRADDMESIKAKSVEAWRGIVRKANAKLAILTEAA